MNLAEQGERATEPPLWRARFRDHGARFALALGLAIFTYLLFPASPAVDFPVYEVGSVASDNVIAPFAFSVPKTDAELTKERDAAAACDRPPGLDPLRPVHGPEDREEVPEPLTALAPRLSLAVRVAVRTE